MHLYGNIPCGCRHLTIMKANVPKESNSASPATERTPGQALANEYFTAMKAISTTLMEALPHEDDLWNILAQAEALLLQAQIQGVPPNTIFDGGVASFCQSIIDEYREAHTGDGMRPQKPAKQPNQFGAKESKQPRGGTAYRHKRLWTGTALTAICLLLVTLMLWYTGILNFWFGGTSYYLNELYNFDVTSTPVSSEPIELTMPLKQDDSLSKILYTDADGYTISLRGIHRQEYTRQVLDSDTGELLEQTVYSWYIRMTYTVRSSFSEVTYIEPCTDGDVTVTLADGTEHTGTTISEASGSVADGLEYIHIRLIEFPADLDLTGATVTVCFDAPNRIHWSRIMTGKR